MAIENQVGEDISRTTALRERTPVKLSVAMITYNHERFLRQALESVLAQRVNFDYEIVIGEDCSTDGTRAILMDFCRRYPDRIVPLLHDRNVGMMRNFQATLNRCRGTYLALLEGDDYWTCADKLQKQVNFLDQNPDYAICSHRVQIISEIPYADAGVWPTHRSAGSYTIKDIISDNFVSTPSVMYRWDSRTRLPDCFLDLRLGDWPLLILISQNGKIKLMDDVMAAYRVHPHATWSTRALSDRQLQSIRMLRAVGPSLDPKYRAYLKKSVRKHYADLSVTYFDMAVLERQSRGSRKAALSYLLNCLRFGKGKVPGRWIDWAAILGFGVLGLSRIRWWRQPTS